MTLAIFYLCNCQTPAAVEKALKGIDGVDNAVVDLNSKTAEVTLNKVINNDVLSNVVTEAGYEVVEVK